MPYALAQADKINNNLTLGNEVDMPFTVTYRDIIKIKYLTQDDVY